MTFINPFMHKGIWLIALLFMAVLVGGGCICTAEDTRTITDLTGEQVILPANLTRAVSIDPFSAQFLHIIGADDRLIATQLGPSNSEMITKYAPYLASLPSAGHKDNLNKEEVVRLQPEVVISSIDYVNANEISEQLGIPFVILDFENSENLTRSYRILGEMFRKEKMAEEFISYYESKMNMIRSDLAVITTEKVKKVYFGQRKAVQTLGNDYYEAEIAKIAGSDNVAEGVSGGDNIVTMDQIYTWNPDVIVLLPYCSDSVESILADPAWQALPAVQNRQVYRMPKFLMTWELPVPESVLAAMWLEHIIYPGYAGYDLIEEIKEFYQRFYKITLSDEDVFGILSDSAPVILTAMS